MLRNKWDAAKCAAAALPFLFLAAYLFEVAIPVPAFLLPERRYVAIEKSQGAAGLKAARGSSREAFAVLPDRLYPLPKAKAPVKAFEAAASLLPETPVLAPILADLEYGLPAWRRARLVVSGMPTAQESAALALAAERLSLPFALDIRPSGSEPEILSLSYRIAPNEERRAFEIQFGPEARGLDSIEIGLESGSAALWRGAGTDLPADLVLRLSARALDLEAGIGIRLAGRGTPSRRLHFDLGVESDEKPRVLVVSGKGQDRLSFVDRVYPAERVDPATAVSRDLFSYELIVVDGLPIAGLPKPFRDGLVAVAKRRTGSLLFVADSPDFGRKGDDPELEALLPIALMPRNLKDLPDLAILILIDVSGSMFGDKLSLAKVTGLELLKNLKPGDRVGMLLFSDERSWVYEFEANSSIVAAPVLEPVRAKGGTDLAAALEEGLGRLAAQGMKERHVVVVSDGVTKPADFQALADQARSIGATVSAMGVGEDANRALLERLAYRAGGRYYRVGSPDEIPALLFEDRKSAARPPFAQGRIAVLALNGDRVATIGGMAQYASEDPATVLFTNELGDPLFASREYGNRAVMLFASDLYGTYTAEFFSKPETAGAFKDRLDALFAEKPIEVSVLEAGRGLTVFVSSDALASPRLLSTRAGAVPVETPFVRSGPSSWVASPVLPARGRWTATILDRGTALSSFPLASNARLAGSTTDAAAAISSWKERRSRPLNSAALMLGLFFASSLAATIVLRVKR